MKSEKKEQGKKKQLTSKKGSSSRASAEGRFSKSFVTARATKSKNNELHFLGFFTVGGGLRGIF